MTSPAAASINAEGDRVYVIVNPATGEPVALPNCSSVLDVVHNFHIPKWKVKMAIVGIARREDLAARAVAASLLPDVKARNAALRDLAEDAIDAGQIFEPDKGFLANDAGTARHLLMELVDEGVVTVDDILALPASEKEHAQAYLDTIIGHGLEIVSSEATVYSFEHGYAGTLDRFARFTRTNVTDPLWEQYDLGRGSFDIDLKFGKNIDAKIAMQLASHVNAEGIYDAATGTYSPLPDDLRRDVGFALQIRGRVAELVPFELGEAWPAFLGGLAIQRFGATNPKQRPLTAPPMTTEVPATSVPQGTVPPAVPSTSRPADDGNPPPSSAGVPPSATVGQAPAGTPTPAGPTAAEVPSNVDSLMDALATSVDAAKAARDEHKANQAASNEGEGPERVTVTPADPDPTPSAAGDPVHISDPLDAVAHQVAIDAAALLFKKHDWLLDRMHQYDDRGRQVLAGYWPAGVLPLKHGIPHTLTELELLTVAVNKTDAELGLPFPDATDPADRQWNEAPAAAVTAIVDRLKALPRDLLGNVTEALAGSGVPKLTDPNSTIYLGHLDTVEGHLVLAEADAKPRLASLATLTGLAAGNGVTQEQLLAVIGKTSVLECTETDAELLCDVIDACSQQVVAFENGVLVPGPQAFAGMKPSEILAAGRAAAKAIDHATPRSAADAAAAPLLAAVHAVRGAS